MNRTILSLLINAIYRPMFATDPNPGGVEAATARTYLTEFGHSADALKAMPDPDVVKLHGSVVASVTKHAPKPTEPTGDVDLKLPEKTTLTAPDLDDIKKFAKEHKVSQAEAERILIREQTAEVRAATKAMNAFQTEANGWIEQVNKDPDLGGANLVETQRLANLAIDKFVKGNDGLIKLLRGAEDGTDDKGQPKYKAGYGQHPAIVRLLRDIGKAMSEDKGLGGNRPGTGGDKNHAAVLYGEPKK